MAPPSKTTPPPNCHVLMTGRSSEEAFWSDVQVAVLRSLLGCSVAITESLGRKWLLAGCYEPHAEGNNTGFTIGVVGVHFLGARHSASELTQFNLHILRSSYI